MSFHHFIYRHHPTHSKKYATAIVAAPLEVDNLVVVKSYIEPFHSAKKVPSSEKLLDLNYHLPLLGPIPMCTLPMMERSTWNRVLYGTHIAYEWSKGNWLAHT